MHHGLPSFTVSIPLDLNHDGIPDIQVTRQLTEKEMEGCGIAAMWFGGFILLGLVVAGVVALCFTIFSLLVGTWEAAQTLTAREWIEIVICAYLFLPPLFVLAVSRKPVYACTCFVLLLSILLLPLSLYYVVVYCNLDVLVLLIASALLLVTWLWLLGQMQSDKITRAVEEIERESGAAGHRKEARKAVLDPDRELARQKELFRQAKRAAAIRREYEARQRLAEIERLT